MKTKLNSVLCMTGLMLLVGCASAPAPEPSPVSAVTSVLGNQTGLGSAIGGVQAPQSVGLTDLLVQQLGVSTGQAQSGAGILFQVAKMQMQQSAFSQLSQAVPGMSGMMAAAPALSGMGGMGGLGGGSIGNAMMVANAFQQSGMSVGMVQQFIPVIIQYVTNAGGNGMASTLSSAFLGL